MYYLKLFFLFFMLCFITSCTHKADVDNPNIPTEMRRISSRETFDMGAFHNNLLDLCKSSIVSNYDESLDVIISSLCYEVEEYAFSYGLNGESVCLDDIMYISTYDDLDYYLNYSLLQEIQYGSYGPGTNFAWDIYRLISNKFAQLCDDPYIGVDQILDEVQWLGDSLINETLQRGDDYEIYVAESAVSIMCGSLSYWSDAANMQEWNNLAIDIRHRILEEPIVDYNEEQIQEEDDAKKKICEFASADIAGGLGGSAFGPAGTVTFATICSALVALGWD